MEKSREAQQMVHEENRERQAIPKRVLPVPLPVAKLAKAARVEEKDLHGPSDVIGRLAMHYGRKSESSAVSGKAIEASTKKDFDCRIAKNKEYYKVDWVPLHEKLPGIIARMQA